MALPTMSLLRIPVSCGAYPIVMRRFFNDRALATNRWLYAAIAVLPIGWLLGCYFIGAPPDTDAVGFIQYDQAYYMAEARGHFDHGFHFFYGLAASPDYDTPRVYFRPQTLLLGALLKYARIDPG